MRGQKAYDPSPLAAAADNHRPGSGAECSKPEIVGGLIVEDQLQRVFDAGREIGALTEAVRTLQARFGDFENHVAKRCTDCTMADAIRGLRTDFDDHEKRLRWVERKLYGAVAVTGLIVYLVDKVSLK